MCRAGPQVMNGLGFLEDILSARGPLWIFFMDCSNIIVGIEHGMKKLAYDVPQQVSRAEGGANPVRAETGPETGCVP